MTGAPASLDLIRRLVGYDTTSARSNLDLIAFVRGHLAAHGVESRLVHDETGGKANLLATIGPADRPGIVLSGHTDVVPATGEGWTDDPFTATLRGERLFGRGAADMKGFIGVVLAFVPAMAARDLRLPVHIALSHDEEVGCIGVRRLLPVMAALPVAPALCLIGEPTGMKVGVAHKGKTAWRVTLRGRECHSGLAPLGVNAIEHAADLVLFIRDLAGGRQTGGPFRAEFEVPHTTLQTGTINGGSALNIVPGQCSFDFEVRNVPGDDPAALLAEIRAHALDRILPAMRGIAPEADITFEALAAYPGLDTPPGSDAVGLVKRLAGANDHTTLAFGTEGGLFREILGTPAVVCGPGHIEDAHRPDEFVSLDQIRACEDFMGRLLDWLSAPA